MSDKLAIPISDQPYYDDSPIGAIKDWHIGVDSRARGTANISGTCTANTAYKLTYATGGFTLNVAIGDVVYNSTDSVYAFVTAKDSDTVLTLDWDAFPDGNESFEIYTPTVPGYGWKRLDTDLTVDDTTSPYYGLTIKAQKAKITEGYDTGWVANSDWTNAEFTVSHNLNSSFSDLIVKFYISTDGTEANAFEIKQWARSDFANTSTSSNDLGYSFLSTDVNSLKIQTATHGLVYVTDSGTPVIINTEAWYYKVKVYRKQDVGIIPIMKVSAGLAVVGSLAVDSLIVNGQDYATQKYTTGWVANSDWTNAEFTVNHNLGYNLSDLIVKFYISTDGTEANAFEIWDTTYTADNTTIRHGGITFFNVGINSLKVQTGTAGVFYILDTGGLILLSTQSYYYKVVVYAPYAISRYDNTNLINLSAADTEWHYVGEAGEPAFTNGWSQYSNGQDVGFRKDALGIVHIKGVLTGGTLTQSAFTLPAGYRPADGIGTPYARFAAIAYNGSSYLAGGVFVNNNGEVTPYYGSSTYYTALDGIQFYAGN